MPRPSAVAYHFFEPFDIDNGELAGLTPQRIFALGVEWQTFRDLLPVRRAAFVERVSAQNATRLRRLCERHGRSVRLRAVDNYWTELSVGAEAAN